MVNTFVNYQMIARDLDRSIERIESQPMVQRETDYYLENIGKVSSIEEFMADDRLFRYAMKAHGLDEMGYAKAYMTKVLEEGTSDPESFANKLTDKRYREFAETYDFAVRGENTTTFNPAQKGAVDNYLMLAEQNGLDTSSQGVIDEVNYYLETIPEITSIDDFLADDRVVSFALAAHGFDGAVGKERLREMLEGGVDDPESPALKQDDERFARFVESFNFARYGEDATTVNEAQEPTVDRYLRQSLEEDAGEQNEGVRLALYFERKAPDIESFMGILADPALAEVMRTALGLPDEIAQADIDQQVAMMERRFDIEDFKDPEKLDEFLKQFTSLWEINNPSSQQSSPAALFGQPAEFGISTDLLLTMAQMKK